MRAELVAAQGEAEGQRSGRRERRSARRWAGVGLVVGIVAGLIGSTVKPAAAYDVVSPDLQVLAPAASGTLITGGGAVAGTVCTGTVVCGAVAVGSAAVFYGAYGVTTKALHWFFDEPEQARVAGVYDPSTSGTMQVSTVPGHTSSTPATDTSPWSIQIYVAYPWGDGSVRQPFTQAVQCRTISTGTVTWQTYSGNVYLQSPGPFNDATHDWTATISCGSGSSVAVERALIFKGNVSFSDGGAVLAVAGTADIDYDARPDGEPAPQHRWRGVKVCAGSGGLSTLTAYSDLFREADATTPELPNPACPAGTLPQSYTVHEGDATGAGTKPVVEWTAPESWSDPSTVEYSDCLPGGSAAPCTLHVLKTTPNGRLECTSGLVDCTDFDPTTETQTQYECRWGTHVMPHSQCAPVVEFFVTPETETDTPPQQQDPDAATDPEGSNSSCLGDAWSLNPVDWVFVPVKCALKWAFVPPPGTFDELTDVGDDFPMNVAGEVVAAGEMFTDAATDDGNTGSDCGPLIDPGTVVAEHMPGDVGEEAGWSSMRMRFPTPSDSGCDGMAAAGTRTDVDDKVGDLWGYRVFIRSMAVIALWVAVFLRVVRSFGGGADDLEQNPFDQVPA